MAITTIYTYPLTGSQREFTVPFEYLARRFVVLTLVGQDRRELVLTTDFRFISKTVVQTTVAWGPADGYERIEIRRNTSATDRLVDFADGSILRASELNISQIQTLHVAEEARNMVADTIAENSDGDLDARGRRLVNLADGVEPGHAVTLRQEQAWALSTLGNRNAAEVAASLAVSAKQAAQESRDISTANAAQSVNKAQEAQEAAYRSEAAAGTIGDNVALAQQARSGAENARNQAVTAAQSVQGLNIPSAIGNGSKWLRQKSDESGFEYVLAYDRAGADAAINEAINTALTQRVVPLEVGRQVLHVRDEKSSGTAGGTFSNNTWVVRDLNTVLINTIPGASLSGNNVTLPPGTYRIRAKAPASQSGEHKVCVFKNTGTIVPEVDILIAGESARNGSGANYCDTVSEVDGYITLTSTTVISLRHRCASSTTTRGLGSPSGFTLVNEVYASMRIERIS